MKQGAGGVDYNELIRDLKSAGPGKLYLLWGPEDYLREQFITQIRGLCLEPGAEDFDAKRLEGPFPDLDELEETLNALPLFGGRTFVELHSLDLNQCKAEDAERYRVLLADIPSWTTVVITILPGTEPDGRLKLVKFLKEIGRAARFDTQTPEQLVRWVTKRFAALGKTIAPPEARRLLLLSGKLMNRLIPEIEKIASLARAEAITASDIDTAAHHIPETDAFLMADSLSWGDYDTAAGLLSELINGNNEPIAVLGAIGWQFRRLYAARLSLSPGQDTKLAAELFGSQGSAVSKLMNMAGKFTLEELESDVRLCAETDYKMKSSGEDNEELLKELLIRFAMNRANA